MEYRSFSSRYGQSSSRAAFPPSPLQKYLSTPRYEAKYKRRSFQYAPRVRHKMAFINGRLVKVYNSAWLADYESHEKKLDVTGKTNQLLILSPYRQFGSSHDVSTIKKSPATLELPTSSGYHSSLSVPSSPFLARRSDNEPNRCFSYNELYSPKSPSTPRRFGLGTRRTYSASDLSSSPSFDRSFGFPPYSPNYRRWTSNYDISFFPDHYSSTDYLNSYRKAGSCDVLFPPSPSSLDWRTLSRLEGGSLGYDFRSRTGSGSFIRKSRLDLDYQADGYCSHTQSECDFPVRYQGPSSKSECGVSPNDVATRSESGISIALSDFDSSFVGADEETASVGSADRSMDRSLDNLSVFPLDFDLERCDTESVMSYDRTLDIVYEDENSDPDQEGDGASGKQDRGKSSASANLLSRFERASMRTFGSDVQQQDDVDDDVFRQHTDILYISDGANVQMDDTDSQHVSNNPDDEFRQHTDILYISDGANVQMDDTDSQHVSNNPVDEFRQHTDILYISDGANVQIDDTDSQHVSNNPDDEFRQHTDILYLRDGANVHVDDTDSQHVSNNPDDEFRQHTDILYIHDGANVHVDDTDSQHVSNNPDDEFRQHMDILYISDGANVHVDETDSKQGVQGSQLEDSRQHTKTLYVTDLSNSQQDDAETSGIVINRVTIEAEDRCEGVTEVAETQVMVKAGNDLHVTRSQSADVSVVGADVSVVGADVSVVGADVSVVGADMRHHSLHLHGDSGLLQQDTEDERHHTDILYLSDAGNVYTEDNHENVATESETHNNVRQHSDKKSNFDLSVLKENTKSENVTEMEDDALRQHTQTIYFTDSNSVFQEDTCDTKSLIIIEAENDTFRQHTHTVHVIDSVRDNDEIRQHTDIVYITDEDNQVIADDEDMRHHTDTVFIRDTGNQQFDEGVHGIADEDEGSSDNIHRHTETLCLIHKDNVDDDDDQSMDESSESDDDSLTQHRQIVYVKDEGDKLVDDGVSDVDYVRSGTETLYVYQSASGQEDNEQFNSDISALERSEEFEIIEMPETLYEHQSESGDEVLVDEDNVRSDTQTMYIHQCTSSQKDNQQLDSDITELEISAIERSEEFEVIEMPETLLSSSFINSSERHRNILEDSLNYIDPFNDSTGVYSRNISVEYDRADQQALDEFIDEREITTSSQIHLALEETADEDSYYRSDNDVRGRSSDEDYADDISSHRLLVQSDRDSSIESEVNVSTSENMDVKQTASTLNEFNTRGNLASGLSPGTLPADCSESSSRYTVINRVSMEAEDRCEGVTEVAETQVMVKAGSDIQSHNVTEFTIQSTSEVFGDENKVPHLLNAVPNETQARSKKPEPGLETDEHSRSRDSNENRRLTGKKAGDLPQVEDPLLSEGDISVKQGGQNPGTADHYRLNSLSAAVTDMKPGSEGSYGAESANSLWKRDNVEEQCVTVKVRRDFNEGSLREGVGCSRVITTRTDAKVELAESEQTADVKGAVIKPCSEERAVTENSDTISDADSPRNGNTQQLLETENADFSSGLSKADSGLSVSRLSGSHHKGEGVYTEELNRDSRGIGSSAEVEKNTGEWTYGVVSVVNTVSSDATSISHESDITENVNVTSRQISEHSERLLNVTDSSVTFGHSDSRNLDKSEQFVVFSSENSAINTVIQTACIETESVAHSDLKRVDSNSEYATSVKDSYERVNERINLYTERENLSKYATQTEEWPISSDELKQGNAGDCQTVNTCVTEPDEALNATGVRLKEPTVLHSDNANTLHIDDFDNGVLSCSVQAGNLGYLANMADSPKVSSAESEQTQVMDDTERGLCFTDRSETMLPVEERSVIRTKVRYKVKKTTKTVTKTNVDVKKVQKHSTGDFVEHEHLTKVEQTTVVRQKVFSSTESLDMDAHDQENLKIEYKAVIDATKDKDGRQLPSAHYETSFETVLPRIVGQNVLHGESEDVLAVCGPETDNVRLDRSTVIAGNVSIEPSPGVVQAVGENVNRASHKPSDVALQTDTGSTEEKTKSDFVVESDSVTSVVNVVSPQTVDTGNSLETMSKLTLTSHDAEVTGSVSPDMSLGSSSSVMKSDTADDGVSDNSLPSEYTERTEIFIQPHALLPITVKRKRWSTERNFADNKLICTVFEDTDSPTQANDEALYILEDNIHVPTNSTDRREDFVVMPTKPSYKNRPYLETRPMWTYDLASLSDVTYVEEGENDSDSTLVDSDGREMEATDRIVSPDSTSNTVQIICVDDKNMEAEKVSTDNSQTVRSEYLQIDSFTNMTTKISKQVTVTNVSHTSESYSDSSKDEEYITDSMTGSASEATVWSLHGTTDSTLSLTGNGGVRSGAELSDTLDTVTVSALPEDEYTDWEETELGDKDVNTGSLFLGGGLSERTNHNVKLTETKQTTRLVISESDQNDDCANFSQTVITVKTDIDGGEAVGSCRDDVVIDDNENILQGKQPDTVSLRPEREVCDLSSSSVSEKKKETEDRRSVVVGRDGGEKIYLYQDVSDIDIRVESEVNGHTERTEAQTDLSRGIETNIDDLQSESHHLVTDASHSVLTLHQTQAAQINSQTEALHSRGDNEGSVLVHNETLSGFSDSDDNLRYTDRTEDKQLGNEPDLMLEGGGVDPCHTNLSTESSQQHLFTSTEDELTQIHGSGTAYSVLEAGDSIDGKQTILPALHSTVDSASTSDGLVYSGHSKVGKLNAETRQNAVCSQSIPSDDGMLINSPSLVDQQAEDLKHANVTRAWGPNEFTAKNVNTVSEVETVDGSSVGPNVEREVTATGELNINAIQSIELEDDSLDCDRETQLQQFSEAFRQYSIEELPLQLSRRKDESSLELRDRITSDNDGGSEEIGQTELDYDDWEENEAALEQIHLNSAVDDGLNTIEETSYSQCAKMEDISSDDVNRSMGSDQLDRLDWLESQVHVEEGQSHIVTTRHVRVTGQVEYDSDIEENNNFVKRLDSSMADDSENSDMDVSDSQYSTTVTCELRDGETFGRRSSTSSDEHSASFSEHVTGELKLSQSDLTSRYLSTSSEGYFSSSDLSAGELRLSIPQDKYRHYSSSSEGYQSIMSDQMTGELKPSPTDSFSFSTEQKTLEMIDEDLKDQIKDFENWSEHLFEGRQVENTQSFSSAEQQTQVLRNTGQEQITGQFSSSASGQMRYENEIVTQSYSSSSEQMTREQTHVEMKLNELTLTQRHSSSDDMTCLVSGRSETGDHLTAAPDRTVNVTLSGQTATQSYSSSDRVSDEMKDIGMSVTLRHGGSTMGQVSDHIQHGGGQIITQTLSSMENTKHESHRVATTETCVSSSSSTYVRHAMRETCEKETYENVPESISEKVKDELLQKAHGYFSSSVSVTLSKKWKMFEKLWHSFDGSSWKGVLTPHLYTFVFQKSNLGHVGSLDQFEKLYPLLLIEDVERCQNHVCTALYSDEYRNQRKIQKYFLRGFTKDIHRLWHSQRKQSLAPLCEIPEDRVVMFSDNAGVALNTCHATSIHPSVVSYTSVSPMQFHRFTQEADNGDSGSLPSGGDNSPDSKNDTSCLQYICQGDVTDPTTMLSKRLRDLNIDDESDAEILDDVLLRCLRHYRSKFIKFNPYIQNDFRRSMGRNPTFPYRNATIYEEEEDEKYMD